MVNRTVPFIFLLSFGVYLFTLCPTVSIGDSGELITASYVLGVAHPPGYPLYLLLAKLFSFIVPIANIAYRVNIFSAFCASLTTVVLYMTLKDIKKTITKEDNKQTDIIIALLSISFTLSFTLWSQAIRAEVYTLNSLIVGLIIWLFIKTLNQFPKNIYVLALVFGIGFANHHIVSLLIPVLLGFFIWKIRSKFNFSIVFFILTIFFIGLFLYMYSPIRSLANPLVDWGNPDSFNGLLNHVFRRQYGKFTQLARSFATVLIQCKIYLFLLYKQWSMILLVFIPIGLYCLWKYSRPLLVFLCVAGFILGPFFLILLNTMDTAHAISLIEEFLVPSYFCIMLIIGSGVLIFSYKYRLIWFLVLISALCYQGFSFGKSINREKAYAPYEYGINILESLPKDSHLFLAGDSSTFILMYLNQVEARRNDLHLYEDTGTTVENIYGDDFYIMPEPFHSEHMQRMQMFLVANARTPVFFILGSNLHNTDISFKPVGLCYMVNPPANFSSLEHWWKYSLKRWQEPVIDANYLERDLIAQYYIALGECFFEEGDKVQAKKFYGLASSTGRDIDVIRTAMAAIYFKKGISGAALEEAESAVKLYPNDPDAYNSLGAACLTNGKLDDAILAFKKAIELKPNLFIAYSNLGLVYIEKELYKEAEEVLKKGLQFKRDDVGAYRHLAVALSKQGQFDESIAVLMQALKLAPQNDELYFILGNSFLKKGDNQNAITAYKESIKYNPNMALAHNNLGVAYGNIRQYDEAIKEYKLAIQLDPSYVEAYNNVAGAYYNKVDYVNAKIYWEKTLKLAPNHPVAKEYIKRIAQ